MLEALEKFGGEIADIFGPYRRELKTGIRITFVVVETASSWIFVCQG
jgi:hypothetical protein